MCACVGAELSPAHVRGSDCRRVPGRLAGKRAGSPRLAPSVGEGGQEAFGTCHSRIEGGDFRAPLAFLSLLFPDRSVSSPPPRSRAPRRRHAPSLQCGPAPRTQLWTELSPPPPERGAAPLGGAGNSRGLSGGAEAESAAPPSTSPGRAGALGPARAGLPEWGRGAASARSCGAGGRGAGRRCCSRAARRARRPCAPALGPPPPCGLRPLPSHTPWAVRAPGLPGAPPPSLHTRPPTRVLQPPAGLAPCRGSSRSQALLTHTDSLAGPPLLTALHLLVLADAAVGGGLMSLQHHAAAAEEGESAAGGLWGLGGMCTRDAAGATRCVPSPFSLGAVTAVASGLSPSCRRLQEGATRMRFFPTEGRPELVPSTALETPRHLTEFRVCICVRARMAVLLAAKCILGAAPRGGGEPLQLCRACACVIV